MTRPLNRILLLEDDPDIQLVDGMTLEAIGGFPLRICGSGREALDAAQGFAPDLFLLDVMRPGMDGPTTLQHMRKNPALAGIPAVFLTAKIRPNELESCRRAGAAEVVPKPFDPMALANTIRQIWERIAPEACPS